MDLRNERFRGRWNGSEICVLRACMFVTLFMKRNKMDASLNCASEGVKTAMLPLLQLRSSSPIIYVL